MSIRSTIFGTALLVIMLTAGAAQSLSGTNTVDSGDIIDRTIGTPDVKVGAFAGQTILDNSMTTNDINEATLVLTCPAGTTKLGDTCFGPEKSAVSFQSAMAFCNTKGMHLPTLSVGTSIATVLGGAPSYWVDNAGRDADLAGTHYAIHTAGGGIGYNYDLIGNAHPYRCVIALGARLPAGVTASELDDDDADGVGDVQPAN